MGKKILVILILVVLIIFGIYYVQNNSMVDNINKQESAMQIEEELIPDDISINMTVTGDVLCHNTNFWDAYNASTDSYDFSY